MVPPPNLSEAVHQATSKPIPSSSRALNENPGNRGSESVSLSVPDHQDNTEKSKEDLAPIFSKLADFEKTLQDLDSDIHDFEKVAKVHLVPKDSLPMKDQAHSAQSALLLSPTIGSPLVQLTKPIPLKDRSNMDLDQSNFKSQSEGKWLRIQRPIHSKENNISEAILGSKVQHLLTHSSDHKAILIKSDGITPRPNRPFKFEQMWLREGGCSDTVITTIKRQVEKKSKLISKAEIDAANGKLDYELVKVLKAEVNDLLDKESQMWQQRSGYRLLVEDEAKEEPSTLDLTTTRRFWKGVWSLRVPNRIKTVLWRAGSDSPPSKANLKKRKIATNDLCPGCKLVGETTLHALWSCTVLALVWATKFAWLVEKTKNCLSLLDVIQCCQENSDCLDLFAMIIS
nr:hypothetical protein CFP56_73265 [Quercus suber]